MFVKNFASFKKTKPSTSQIERLPKAQKIKLYFTRRHRIEIKHTDDDYFKISKSRKDREQKITQKQHEDNIYFSEQIWYFRTNIYSIQIITL